MNIGIKYCGGCNSYYDRVAFAGDLKQRYADKVNFFAAQNDETYDAVIVICGCSRQCANHSAINARLEKIIVTQREIFENVCTRIEKLAYVPK